MTEKKTDFGQLVMWWLRFAGLVYVIGSVVALFTEIPNGNTFWFNAIVAFALAELLKRSRT